MAADTGQDLVKGEPELCLEHEEDANHINIKVPLRPPFLEQDWLGCERDLLEQRPNSAPGSATATPRNGDGGGG